MDVIAHGLWAGGIGALASPKVSPCLRPRFFPTVFWGVFPDLLAFLPMAAVLLMHRFYGEPVGPRLLFSRAVKQALPRSLWPEVLYEPSHSLLVFLLAFLLTWLVFRRPILALLGWPLHILMDIPTHGGGIYRTPFLWPLSSYRFNGIWWSRRWFIILNYSLIVALYVALFIRLRMCAQRPERRGAR